MAKILIRVDLEPEEELYLSHSTLELAEVVVERVGAPQAGQNLRRIEINVESWERFHEETGYD